MKSEPARESTITASGHAARTMAFDLHGHGRPGDLTERPLRGFTPLRTALSAAILFCVLSPAHAGEMKAIEKKSLAEKMKLRPEQTVILTQSVGYPAK